MLSGRIFLPKNKMTGSDGLSVWHVLSFWGTNYDDQSARPVVLRSNDDT